MMRLFTDEFIAKCRSKLPVSTPRSPLLGSNHKCLNLIDTMRELHCDERGAQWEPSSSVESNESESKDHVIEELSPHDQTEYELLLNAILEAQKWCEKYDKPYVPFCRSLLSDVISYVQTNWPALSEELVRQAESDQSRISENKTIRCCNRVGMCGCFLWSIPQSTLTLFNLFGTKTIALEKGDIDPRDACSSIVSLCEDNDERTQEILAMEGRGARIHWKMLQAQGISLSPRPQSMS